MATVIDSKTIKGYRQVEINHVSAPRNGQVYGQLPADITIDTLEQGTIVQYDYAHGKVVLNGAGGDAPQMMVYNEEKLYDERKQAHKDYAMKKEDFYDGLLVPRVFRLVVGDLFTTNNLADGSYTEGDVVAPNADGRWAAAGEDATGLKAIVTKCYTLPDGQPAVKLQVISE